MTCTPLYDDNGNFIGIACGSTWGMGVTTYEDGESTYGFGHGGNPHNFSPDYEVNTDAEIKAWKEACELWDRLRKEQ